MVTIGAYEAKTHLPQLLERVARGEHIVITRHGVPVAELSPVEVVSSDVRRDAIARLKAFRQEKRVHGAVKAMIEEGRL